MHLVFLVVDVLEMTHLMSPLKAEIRLYSNIFLIKYHPAPSSNGRLIVITTGRGNDPECVTIHGY